MDIDALLQQAREDRGNSVTQCCVNLVKARNEYNKLGGTVNYKSILSAIVDSYGTTGVKYSLVREVLHDTEGLNAAVTELVTTGEIAKGNGKRDFLLTTTKSVDQQKGGPQPSDSDHSEDDDEPGEVPPAASKSPVKPSK